VPGPRRPRRRVPLGDLDPGGAAVGLRGVLDHARSVRDAIAHFLRVRRREPSRSRAVPTPESPTPAGSVVPRPYGLQHPTRTPGRR
jgi:hypothetical protein